MTGIWGRVREVTTSLRASEGRGHVSARESAADTGGRRWPRDDQPRPATSPGRIGRVLDVAARARTDAELRDALAAASPDEVADANELLDLSIALSDDAATITEMRMAFLVAEYPSLDDGDG